MKITFSEEAELNLSDVWGYTDSRWGEEQADTYVKQLMADIDMLPQRRYLWRRYPEELGAKPLHFVRIKHHYVFFQELTEFGELYVLTILHEAMDLTARLRNL